MDKINKLWVLVALAAAVGVVFALPRPEPQSYLPTLQIGEATLSIEVADTEALKMQGLSGRDSLPENSGMLFKFDVPNRYSFWMKDMRFPLDFIWIANGRVTEIDHNVPVQPGVLDERLNVYQPLVPVDSMLEVNSGWAEKQGIKAGDSVKLLAP